MRMHLNSFVVLLTCLFVSNVAAQDETGWSDIEKALQSTVSIKFQGREKIRDDAAWVSAKSGRDNANKAILQLLSVSSVKLDIPDGGYGAAYAGEFTLYSDDSALLATVVHFGHTLAITVPSKKKSFYQTQFNIASFMTKELEAGLDGKNSWHVRVLESERELED